MATADELLELMFSWIDQRERCARQLKKLADELESLREKCNASECVGSTVSVTGAACLLGAGAATLFTGGAAAPFLGLLGGVYTGVGVTVSVVTKLTEHFVSSDTMKKAENTDKESNNIAKRIQKQFDQLKAEIKKVSPSAEPDEVDRHVMLQLLGAMARRSGLKVDITKIPDEAMDMLQPNQSPIDTIPIVLGILGLVGILTFFTCKPSGKGSKLLVAEGTKRLTKQMSTTGVKTAFKGGAMMVGGAVGLAFALPEAVNSWKEAIKKNHVTEASQSLRDTADTILKMTRKLREGFDNMRKMLEEQERIRKAKQEEQERIRKARRQTTLFSLVAFLSFSLVLIYYNIKSSNSAQEQRETQETCLETQISIYQSLMTKTCILCEQTGSELERENQQNEQTGSEQQGRDDQGDKERDQEDKESDQGDEERDQEDKESDQEDEESDQEDEESDQEDEERDQEDEERQQVDDLPNMTTFEHVATVLQHDTWNKPILFITVYRTGYLTRADLKAFQEEFQILLDHYRNYNIIVAGDFNIWVDAVKSIPSSFLEFLRNNNLVQHVNEPTHKKNHILDLVISRNVDISDLSVQNDRISDHYTVSFTVKDQEGKAVKVGLLNCRSVNNKPEKIRDLIERNNLDILLLTETWSKDITAKKVLRKASPEGFSFCYKSREERGGGVAILFRKELLKRIDKMKSKKQDQDESAKRFKKNEE